MRTLMARRHSWQARWMRLWIASLSPDRKTVSVVSREVKVRLGEGKVRLRSG